MTKMTQTQSLAVIRGKPSGKESEVLEIIKLCDGNSHFWLYDQGWFSPYELGTQIPRIHQACTGLARKGWLEQEVSTDGQKISFRLIHY